MMKKLQEKKKETKPKENELGAISGSNFTVDLFAPTSITRKLDTTVKSENKTPGKEKQKNKSKRKSY